MIKDFIVNNNHFILNNIDTISFEDTEKVLLDSAFETIKLNYKCKAGTVDDSNKCEPEQEKPIFDGVPQDLKLGNEFKSAKQAISRNEFNFKTEKKQGMYDTVYKIRVIPKKIPTEWKNKKDTLDDKNIWYDPTYMKEIPFGNGKSTVVIPINPEIENQMKLPSGKEKGYLFRGMSYEEFEGIKNNGYIKTEAQYNFDFQGDMTFFSDEKSTAANYASGFAPWQYAPTIDKPAIMIKIKDPGNHEKGTTEGEIGIRGKISDESITEVYIGRPVSMVEGYFEIVDNKYNNNVYRGNASTYKSNVIWEIIPYNKQNQSKQDSAYLADAFETIKLNYKCPKGTVDDSNACVSNSNNNTSSNKPKNDIVSLKEEQKAIKSILLDYNRLSQPKDDSYNQLSKRLKEINDTLDSEKPKSVSVDITAPSRPALEKMIQGDPKFDDDPLPWDEDYNVKLGGTLYQIRLEGWYDDCLESRGYDKIDPDKYQDVIQSDFKQIISDESGWGNSKENIYGYVPNVPGTTYGVTYIGRPIKTKQNSEYLEDATDFIKLNYKCPKGTVDDSNKCEPEQEKGSASDSKHTSETFIGFKADHDFSSPQDVETNKRIQASLDKAAEPLKKFSKNDRHVLTMYSGGRFHQINEYLNGSMKDMENSNDVFDKAIVKESKQLIEKLDKLFTNSDLSEPLVTYRGISNKTLSKYPELVNALDTPGSEIEFPCFSSTSALPFMANNFTTDENGRMGRLLELQLPSGTKALFIAEESGLPNEFEILVNRGTKFKVVETRYTDIIPPNNGSYKDRSAKHVKITTIKAIV